ncbi:hypothetical protein ABIF38_002882 [Bradyrhizobium japonicum]|uniref:Uncharacterized protein n=1 Tax=Bradyrhizobium elkanii TaxID=29448 RepID=A0ABV4FD12_BRAEL|nr:hypothetical protein [Bradyrhizobium elkanii]MCP1734806.1 hypothetical protein [Bradyrhizobium elkanii]MCP1752912.1 hypothetical protein [Bradyrhizobium elkanii]MCP1975340.1 hypothetical protein [Bradyrhizobium elkanii]MCS3570145.1 hypothetical protein [Bradyrhizobium elkanii]
MTIGPLLDSVRLHSHSHHASLCYKLAGSLLAPPLE